MSDAEVHKCSFCGIVQSADTPLIAGMDGHLCESCVTLAHQVVSSWGVLEGLLQRTMFDLPSIPGVLACRVEAPAVEAGTGVELVYAESGGEGAEAVGAVEAGGA